MPVMAKLRCIDGNKTYDTLIGQADGVAIIDVLDLPPRIDVVGCTLRRCLRLNKSATEQGPNKKGANP